MRPIKPRYAPKSVEERLEEFKAALALAATGTSRYGAKNLYVGDVRRFDPNFYDVPVRDLQIDNVRVIGATITLNNCDTSTLVIRKTELEAIDVSLGSLAGIEVDTANIRSFSLIEVEVDNALLSDACLGRYLWPVGSHAVVIETDFSKYLPEGLNFVRTPFDAHSAGCVMINQNKGRNIILDGTTICGDGSVFSMIGHNTFDALRMVNGRIGRVSIDDNVFTGSHFENTVFFKGAFANNCLIDTPLVRCLFDQVNMSGSIIEMTPHLLSSRFQNCIAVPNQPVYYYGDHAVIGVKADEATGYLVPDIQAENLYRNPTDSMMQAAAMKQAALAACKTFSRDDMRIHMKSDRRAWILSPEVLSPIPFSDIYPQLVAEAERLKLLPVDHPARSGALPGVNKAVLPPPRP